MRLSLPRRARRRRVRAGGDEFGHRLARIGPGTSPSPTSTASAPAEAYSIRSCGPRTPDSAILTTLLGRPGAMRSNVVRSTSRVLQVAGVDPDDPGPGVEGAVGLFLGVHLDQRGHAERLDPLEQADQGVLVERGDDQQHHVGAVGAGLVDLVGADDEVLAQDRDRHLGPNRVEVVERAAEAALLGEHADDAGAAGLVVGGQPGRVGDRGRCHPRTGCGA